MTTQKTMKHGKKLDRGSALLVALMIMVVLSLTGLSFLYIADSENSISNNYTKGLETLTTASTGVRIVSGWLNAPDNTNLVPSSSEMVLNTRTNATDSTGAATTYGGNFMKPYWGIVGNDNVIQRFYGNPESKTNPTNPDILIDLATGTSAIRTYLKNLNTTLFGADTRAVITKIEVYSGPTYPDPDHPWNVANTLYGICTVRVTANMYKRAPIPNLFDNYSSFNKETISTRIVRGILGETFPFQVNTAIDAQNSYGIHGNCVVHWGIAQAFNGNITIGNCNNIGMKWYTGAPWHWQNNDWTTKICELDPDGFRPKMPSPPAPLTPDNRGMVSGDVMLDPWLMYRTGGGTIDWSGSGSCNGPISPNNPNSQGNTYDLAKSKAAWDNTKENGKYNVFAGATFTWADNFPTYEEFKDMVLQNSDNDSFHYCRWISGTTYKCTGISQADFGTITANAAASGKGGIWFFDTQNQQDPASGGVPTPAVSSGGCMLGVWYLNSASIDLSGSCNLPVKLPGEPFIDKNDNGKRDHGEPFINLQGYHKDSSGNFTDTSWISLGPGHNTYNSTVDWNENLDSGLNFYTDVWTPAFTAEQAGTVTDAWEDGTVNFDAFYDAMGPTVNTNLQVSGVLFNLGDITGSGNGQVYGSLIAGGNVFFNGTEDVFYDECLRKGCFEIPGLDASTITQMMTDY